MLSLTVDTDESRRAFLGLRFQGYFWNTDCHTYTSFRLVWTDDRKEEIVEEDREEPISLKIHMN